MAKNNRWVPIKGRPKHFYRNGVTGYCANFMHPNGKSTKLWGFDSNEYGLTPMKDWERKKAERIANYKSEAGLDKDYAKYTFEDIYPIYLEDAGADKPKTLIRKQDFMLGKILPRFKDTVVSKVTEREIENFYKDVQSESGIKQVLETHKVLNQFFNFLVKSNRCITENPAPKYFIERLKKQNSNSKKDKELIEKPIDLEDAKSILKAVKGNRDEIVYHWAIYHGCRPSEALGVDWSNVDLRKDILHIRQQIVDVSARQVAGTTHEGKENVKIGTPKTPESNRDIPLHPHTKALLLQTPVEERKGLVYLTTKGTPCTASNWQKNHFKPQVVKLGLENSTITQTYDLRKYFATHHARVLKTSAYILMDLMGHTDIKITMDYYVKKLEDVEVQFVNILDDEKPKIVEMPTTPTGHPNVTPIPLVSTYDANTSMKIVDGKVVYETVSN